jgi:NitT/TauT family transport system ATP-binding protein
LYVTHNFQEAIRIADRVCVLSRRPGRVREIIAIPITRADRAKPANQAAVAALGERLWSLIKEEAIVADRELVAHV